MPDRYVFRKIEQDEVLQMFHLILERMKWMDEKGIRQWNVTKYDEAYPLSYYEEERARGELFVLYDTEKNQIASAAVLKEQDERWQEDVPALYLHNFVTRIGEKGAGAIFLAWAEKLAIERGKCFFRLDSAEDNLPLARYYEAQGFAPVGTCEEGLYKGILREKKLYY